MLVLLVSLAAGAATLSLTGECGGPVAIDVTGLTPGGNYAILTADAAGATTVNGGPCPGITLGLETPFDRRKTGQVDGSGELHIAPSLPAPLACGLHMQVVDVATCTPSNVAVIPGTDADGDGWYGAEDCDDGDASVFPGAPEVCDGQRNDCDDPTWTGDDGLVTWVRADGAVVDYTADFASGYVGAPADIVLDDGDGVLSICPGTYHADLSTQVNAGDVTIRGLGGSAVTTILGSETPGYPHTFTRQQALTLEGLTVGGNIRINPPVLDVTVTDLVQPDGADFLTISSQQSVAPGTVDLALLTLGYVSLVIDDDPHVVTVTDSDLDRFDIRCGGSGATIDVRNHTDGSVPAVGAGPAMSIFGCTATLDTATLDDPATDGVVVSSGSVVTATDLTVGNGGTGIFVFDSQLDATRLVAEDSEVCVKVDNGSAVVISDSELRRCGAEASNGAVEVSLMGTLDLIDSVVELAYGGAYPPAGGGASISGGALTCTKTGVGPAGFFSNTPYGVYLRSEASLTSNGCDWGNGTDVGIYQSSGDDLRYDFGDDATFTCSVQNGNGNGGCVGS